MTSITPAVGGVNGGLQVTIEGTGFGNSKDNVSVDIGNTSCTILSVNMSNIVCRTGAHSEGTVSVEVIMI